MRWDGFWRVHNRPGGTHAGPEGGCMSTLCKWTLSRWTPGRTPRQAARWTLSPLP